MTSTSTTASLLANLNTIRAANGQPPLKSWKGSRAALEAQIAKYGDVTITAAPPAVAEGAYPTERVARASTGHSTASPKQAKASIPAPKAETTSKKGPKVKVTKVTKAPSDTITLSEIAADAGLSPKAARARARRSQEIADLCIDPAHWTFAPASRTKVLALLTPKKDAN